MKTPSNSIGTLLRPKITVVTPSFNQGDYIERTINSVLSQNYQHLEFIIIDGKSTDQSVEIIRRYEKHLTFWVSEKDRGQSHAINKGMARATGDILTWLNSDDWYEAEALATFAREWEEFPDTGVLVGAGRMVDLGGAVLGEKPAPPVINFESICGWLSGGDFMQPSAAFSREAWEAVGPLNEDIHIALDVDLWLRIARAGFSFRTVPTRLSTALSHPKAKTTALLNETVQDCARVVARHGSLQGYEDAVTWALRENKWLSFRLSWLERNYRIVAMHPLLRALQPIVKRFAREGGYWQRDLPEWMNDGGK